MAQGIFAQRRTMPSTRRVRFQAIRSGDDAFPTIFSMVVAGKHFPGGVLVGLEPTAVGKEIADLAFANSLTFVPAFRAVLVSERFSGDYSKGWKLCFTVWVV